MMLGKPFHVVLYYERGHRMGTAIDGCETSICVQPVAGHTGKLLSWLPVALPYYPPLYEKPRGLFAYKCASSEPQDACEGRYLVRGKRRTVTPKGLERTPSVVRPIRPRVPNASRTVLNRVTWRPSSAASARTGCIGARRARYLRPSFPRQGLR